MLKGKAEILLTDVNNGKKQIIKEENMVTNSLQNLANACIYDVNFAGKLKNLKNYFSGLFLLNDTLDEDPNKFILPNSCELIGHAGNELTNGSILKGSYNEIESAELDNGYKFVWDFSTNQANGIIKSLSLVNYIAGNKGFGVTPDQRNIAPRTDDIFEPYYSSVTLLNNMYTVNSEFSVKVEIGDMAVKIKKYQNNFNRISLMKDGAKLLEEKIVEVPYKLYNNYMYFNNDKIYISSAETNSYKNSVVYEIDLIKYELLRIIKPDDIIGEKLSYYWQPAVIDNDLYLFPYYKPTTFYIINLENLTLKDSITCNISIDRFYGVYNNRLLFNTLFIDGNKIRIVDDGYTNSFTHKNIYAHIFSDSIISTSNATSSLYGTDTNESRCYCANIYTLQTINNLATPIIKNSTQTMKITYEITEE